MSEVTEGVSIKISDVINMMGTGFTRTPKNANYNSEIGSIMEHYDLDEKNTRELFRHPKLSGLKTSVPFVPVFSVIDDVAVGDSPATVDNTGEPVDSANEESND